MKKLLWLSFAAVFCFTNFAFAKQDRFQGFVAVSAKQKLYVDYVKPEAKKPTVVLLNGLTYSTRYWDSFVKELSGEGYGILRYDMRGMGKTLLNDPLPVNYEISYKTQSEDLAVLLKKLRIKKAHILGLSYGGAIATAFASSYPSMIDSTILMAPFTEPLKKMDDWIRYQVSVTRASNPWNPASDDELYDFFLRQFVYSSYPSAEPSVLENPYKLEATFRMVQGVRKFLAASVTKQLPKASTHLLIALQDQYIPVEGLKKFWNKIPKDNRASLLLIDGSEHKIPETIPHFSSAWVKEILNGNEKISAGIIFEGNVSTGEAKSGSIRIPLAKD